MFSLKHNNMNKLKITVIFIFILIISINSNYSINYDLKPHHIDIAEQLFRGKKPFKLKDHVIDGEMSVYALNGSQYESFCYFFICSLYDRILGYYKNIKDDNQEKFFAELNKEENYTLLYDFLNSVLLNKRTNRDFKTNNIEIREGYEQNYKYYSIKFGDLATGQFVFNFSSDTLPSNYEIWKNYYDKMVFTYSRKQDDDECEAAIFCIQASIYCSITMDSYSPGIFYDSLFLEGKAYTPHE